MIAGRVRTWSALYFFGHPLKLAELLGGHGLFVHARGPVYVKDCVCDHLHMESTLASHHTLTLTAVLIGSAYIP